MAQLHYRHAAMNSGKSTMVLQYRHTYAACGRKGLLMTRQQMTEPEAFRWIQRTAMDRRTTMKAVAEAVVEGLATPRA